ncbi:AAA domain-containing protein [Candidatus Marinarcus aquaticus]|uniref:DNA helicase n=1 Tax=Candidatus Marinarcus aquaticus TaxID=2044504 RepID=A0A4Q0XN96_9BACT|nr:AAA domain-containing protein [Candidatus Marinarcus aquaticus]RXJ55241.1 DNA helicase [Candidatus Marinarcus aquaticus]
MDKNKYLIIIDNKDKTEDIEQLDFQSDYANIKFITNDTVYKYKKHRVVQLELLEELDPSDYILYLDGKLLSNIIKIQSFKLYFRIFYENGRKNIYKSSRLTFEKNCLTNKNSKNILEYLKELSKSVDEENDFLFNSYDKMTFISEKSVLSKYLNASEIDTNENKESIIFPFGFNLSQEKAVQKALLNQISVIEGPPGTGKTQTILNIIANLIMRNKTIAIVSNNNAATKNVFEKLEKYDLSFISAFLGNKDNKEEFFSNQNTKYPEFIKNKKDIDLNNFTETIVDDIESLKVMLEQNNELSKLKQLQMELKVEKNHFLDLYEKREDKIDSYHKFNRFNTENILSLWADFEKRQKLNKKISFLFKFKILIKYRILLFSLYKNSIDSIILLLQKYFYIQKEKEVLKQIKKLEDTLKDFDFDNSMKLFSEKSMLLFKAFLSNKYGFKTQRDSFDDDILWKSDKFDNFIEEYPVVLSTTHSLRNCIANGKLYDYLIIDEASQVAIVAGSLALSCAKNVVVVGDLKQLPHVIKDETKEIVNNIYNNYKVSNPYNYEESLLSSISKIYKDIPKTLLKEHYRCHPRIIGFCNKKFYNNELIVLTKQNDEDIPLTLYKTVEGNHARGTYNQRQIDVIEKEILPNIDKINIGIASPFRKQVSKLNNLFENDEEIVIDTVHKYQGREKNIMILSTVVDKENDFVDNENLLNVAISRAVDKLFVVVSDREKNKNMKDLVNYIKYNNLEIKESKVYSIFDLLYQSYSPYLKKYLTKYKSLSKHKSENLMNIVIEQILSEDIFSHLGRVIHMPLNRLIRDLSILTEREQKFVLHPESHIDFLIYNKINNSTVLAVEVDGYAYHENNPEQLERDRVKDSILNKSEIAIMRFKTNDSKEEKRLKKCLINLL